MTPVSRLQSRPRRGASASATSASDLSTPTGPASCAPTGRSAPTQGTNFIGVSDPVREQYFERRRIKEAIAFAEAGGIAIHRNFDYYHGSTIRGMVRERPFLHVIGLWPGLAGMGRQQGLRPEWIQPEKRRKVAHYD